MFFSLLCKGFYDRFPEAFRQDAIVQSMLEFDLKEDAGNLLFDLSAIYTTNNVRQWSIMRFLAPILKEN
jgi:hypothetical protein